LGAVGKIEQGRGIERFGEMVVRVGHIGGSNEAKSAGVVRASDESEPVRQFVQGGSDKVIGARRRGSIGSHVPVRGAVERALQI